MDKFSIRDFLIGGLVFKALGDALGKRRYGTLLFLILVVIILFVLYLAFRLLKWVIFDAIPAFAGGVREGAEEAGREFRKAREAKAAAAAREEAARLAARRYYSNEEGLFELTTDVVEIEPGEAYVRVDEISDDAFGSLDVESIQPARSMSYGGRTYALGKEVFELDGRAGHYVQMSSLMPALKPGRFAG